MTEVARTRLLLTVIVVALIGSSWLALLLIPHQTRSIAQEWLRPLAVKTNEQLEQFSAINATEPERARLKDQLTLLRARAEHHLQVMVYFYSNYYMAILQAFSMGAIAAVSLFFITKVGYASAKPYVKGTFITATVLSAFFGAFPSVFRQPENISDNKTLYLKYCALENEMLTYGATKKGPNSKEMSPSEFIAYIDLELNKTNNFAIGFDATKITAPKFDLK